MDIQVSMVRTCSFLIIGVGVGLSPLSSPGPRSGVPPLAMSAPAPSLGPALCSKEAAPQGHLLSLRTSLKPAELHSSLSVPSAAPQIRSEATVRFWAWQESRGYTQSKSSPHWVWALEAGKGNPRGFFRGNMEGSNQAHTCLGKLVVMFQRTLKHNHEGNPGPIVLFSPGLYPQMNFCYCKPDWALTLLPSLTYCRTIDK